MSITFQKRQKELKRQEKQRAKAERAEQKKPPYALQKRRKARRQQRPPVLNSSLNSRTNYSSVHQPVKTASPASTP